MKKIPLIVAVSLLPAGVLAQDANNYRCSLDELARRVEVQYETGVTVPCEVHYYKETEMPGDRQVLWRALSEEGYCEAKAAELVKKLEGMGWTCWAGSQPPEEGETDDTDALAPAEEEIEIPEADVPES